MSLARALSSLAAETREFIGAAISWPLDLIGNGFLGVAPSQSGIIVNEFNAMQCAAYYACVRIISDQIATLPLHVYEVQPDGSEIVAEGHPYERMLQVQPNPETCAADFRQAGQGHLLMSGNCYIEMVENNAGRVAELYLRSPFRTFPYRKRDGSLWYKTSDTMDGHERVLPADSVIQIRGFGLDGLVGLSPVKVYAKEVLGVDLAAQAYGAKFFANDARPGGYLKSATMMKDAQKLSAVSSWNAAHTQGNQHRVAVLDGGITWEKVGTPPEEAQFIATRQLNRSQIASIFGVPGHMVGDDADAPRAVLEQKGVEFLLYTIRPWARKWDSNLTAKLFPGGGKYLVRFDTSSLERPTFDVLLKGIQVARYAGLMTINDGRRALKLNPLVRANFDTDNPAERLMIPVNMMPVDDRQLVANTIEEDPNDPGAPKGGLGGAPTQPPQKKPTPKAPQTMSRVFEASFRDAFNRLKSRKDPKTKDYDQVFTPVLLTIAAASRDLEEPEDALPGELVDYVRGYVAGMAHRGLGDFEAELDRAVREIFARSAAIPPAIGDEDDPDIDPALLPAAAGPARARGRRAAARPLENRHAAPFVLFLARHGESVDDVQGKSSGPNATPLTRRGELQAMALAAKAALQLPQLAGIFAPDVLRHQQTAAAVSKATGVPVTVDADLDPWRTGDLEGAPREELKPFKQDPDAVPPGAGAESLNQSIARTNKAIVRHLLEAQRSGPQLLVMSHKSIRYYAEDVLDSQVAYTLKTGGLLATDGDEIKELI